MAEFFRFRSIKSLLEEYEELEKQTIYFASPEEMNDPMEGFRDIVWSGDKIVWTNLFRHYVYCVHRTCLLFTLIGGDKQLDADPVQIFGPCDERVMSQDKDLFDDIWTRFLNVPQIQAIIEAIANIKRKIRYRDMLHYLRVVHFVVLEEILKSYVAHGFMSQSKMPRLAEELNDSSMLEVLLYSIRVTQGTEDTELSDDALLPLEIIDNNENIFRQYHSRTISNGILEKNDRFVRFDFPKAYLEQLERLLWPKWYAACFMKSCHNSSVWGNYGDNHKGVCLIFEAEEANKSKNLELCQLTGKNVKTMPFRKVRYKNKTGEVDFFRSIGRLTVAALMNLWYTDREGNISECASHIRPDGDEDVWRKSYWANFFRDITIKTKDWEYEQEYRLILEDGLSEFDDMRDRTLTYNFNSLKGIVFGLNTSDEDKQRIIKIIEEKCRKNNRVDFKLYQAYYSHKDGDIRKYEVRLPFRLNLPPGTSKKVFDAEFRFHQGNLKFMLKKADEAIKAYTRAIELYPDYVEAHLSRGVAYNVKREFNLAIEDFAMAIDLKPELAPAYYHRGHAYDNRNDYNLAIEDYTKAIQLNPSLSEGHLSRGVVYAKKGMFDSAIEDYTKAIQLNHNFVEAYFGRGVANGLRGEFSLAIKDFSHVIQLKSDFAEARCSRGSIYVKKGDTDRAMEDFNTAIELKPEYAEAYCNRGNVYLRKGEIDRAIRDYDKAIELEPDYIKAYYNRGTAYADKANFDLAILDYNRIIELKPDDADAYFGRGVAYFKKDDYDQAIEDFAKGIESRPDFVDIFHNRGAAYYLKGEYERAIEDYDRVIELKTDAVEVYNHRGVVYYKKGEYNRAIEDYDVAIKRDSTDAYYNRGEAWLHLKEWEKAKNDLITAKKLGVDIVAAFRNDYRNVAAFERANQVRMPEDIAALVRQGFRDRYPKKEKVLTADGEPLDSSEVYNLVKRLRDAGTPLGEYIKTQPFFGIKTTPTDVFVVDRKTRDKLIAEHPSSENILKPFLHGRDIRRWRVEPAVQWLIFSYRGIEINAYPAIRNYLEKHRDSLNKGKGKGGWYELQASVEEISRYAGPKLVCPNLYNTQTFAVETDGYFCGSTCYVIPTDETWLCGLLNTPTVKWFYSHISDQLGPGELKARSRFIKQIPVPNLNVEQKDLVRKIVEYLIFLQNQPTTNSKDLAHANDFVMLKYFERIINGLVYEFYMPEVVQGGNRDIFKHLMAERLPEAKEIQGDKMPLFRSLFERLNHREHPVQVNLFFQDSLRPIRIIEDKW